MTGGVGLTRTVKHSIIRTLVGSRYCFDTRNITPLVKPGTNLGWVGERPLSAFQTH